MPYQYWPGWKRGLLITRLPAFGLLPWTAVAAGTDWLGVSDPWWLDWPAAAAAWLPLAGYGTYKATRFVQNYRYERDYLRPVRNAVIATLRTRDGVFIDIPRGLVRGRDQGATGRIGLPSAHPLHDGDRDNLVAALRERLGHDALDARFNMQGAHPHMELFTPPQPPPVIGWDTMLDHWDAVSPYLGHTATGPVHWDLGEDSPHVGIGGGSGSGKSELLSWIVAQFMRAGCGTVVLDPKYVSHRWLSAIPQVLYCREAAMLHDTILWLDSELRRRGLASVQAEEDFPRIVVVLEERNSLQTILREHWVATRPKGAPMRSPALAALDRLASQGRAFNINVVLAAQEVTKADIGSRNNFGAFCLAGRLPVGAWRLVMGPGAKKPAMSIKPGRFGYAVAGQSVVFQAAYPNLRAHADRLVAWATSGAPLLDVRELMQQHEMAPFPSYGAVASAEDDTDEWVTLRQFVADDDIALTLSAIRSCRDREGRGFPDHVGTGDNNTKLYRLADLDEWYQNREATA
jgi:hypothetical protein